jgi:hypothetical protein
VCVGVDGGRRLAGEGGLREDAVRESRSVMVLSNDAIVITGLDATTAVRDGKTMTSPGRVN